MIRDMNKIISDQLKLTFIKRLREKFVDGLDSLKGSSEDDYKDGQMGRHDLPFDSYEAEVDYTATNFFIPFVEFLDSQYDDFFLQPKGEPSFAWMKNRILELNKFIFEDIFKPASALFEEALTQKNFDDVIRKFDDLIFEVLQEEEVEP